MLSFDGRINEGRNDVVDNAAHLRVLNCIFKALTQIFVAGN